MFQSLGIARVEGQGTIGGGDRAFEVADRNRGLRFLENPAERIADRGILLTFENPLLEGEGIPVLRIGGKHRLQAIEGFGKTRGAFQFASPSQTGCDCRPPGLGVLFSLDLRHEPGPGAVKEPFGLSARPDLEGLPEEARSLCVTPFFEEGSAATDEVRGSSRVESFAL